MSSSLLFPSLTRYQIMATSKNVIRANNKTKSRVLFQPSASFFLSSSYNYHTSSNSIGTRTFAISSNPVMINKKITKDYPLSLLYNSVKSRSTHTTSLFLSPSLSYSSPPSTSTSTSVQLGVGVNSAGVRIDRPISPHVEIYSQPLPALSSIANRVTGSILSVGVIGVGCMGIFVNCDLVSYVNSIHLNAPIAIPLLKLLVSFPLIYHYLAGIRHIYWDRTAKGLELASVELSSQLLIGTSVIASILVAIITI